MTPKVEKLNVPPCSVMEGPHWDEETQTLYYVDIIQQTINKYVPSTGKHTKASIDKNVSIIIPAKGKDDEFIITYDREIVLITWDGESEKVSSLKKLYEVEPNTENVFNDGKCDPSGRLWTGTLAVVSKSGKIPKDIRSNFYSFQNGQITKQISNVSLSNGLAFDTKANKFYYIDSFKGTIDQYDFDMEKGTISNGRPIFTLFGKFDEDKLELLDGMAIDSEGNLWVAVFNQSKVIKIDPRKPETIADTIEIPAKQVTSVTFGGPNLDELYVTTARYPIKGVTPSSPNDGVLYKVTGLNVKGLPGNRVVL